MGNEHRGKDRIGAGEARDSDYVARRAEGEKLLKQRMPYFTGMHEQMGENSAIEMSRDFRKKGD